MGTIDHERWSADQNHETPSGNPVAVSSSIQTASPSPVQTPPTTPGPPLRPIVTYADGKYVTGKKKCKKVDGKWFYEDGSPYVPSEEDLKNMRKSGFPSPRPPLQAIPANTGGDSNSR